MDDFVLQKPFSDDWRLGYLRLSEKDGRRRVDLFNTSSNRTTISYARYLVCVELGEYLPEGLEVDHVDGDRSHDVIENLEILTIQQHRAKTTKERGGRTVITFVCPVCSTVFERERRCVKVDNPKCSRSCNGLESMMRRYS